MVGQKTLVRLINPASSYLCSNDVRAHFGLGQATDFDRIDVGWPDGTGESFPGGRSDRAITLEKGKGTRRLSLPTRSEEKKR